jgi:hypothetical protein
MVKQIVCAVLMAMLAGCGYASFSETVGGNMPAQLKTFSVGEFTGSDPALAQLFARTIKNEFEKAGFPFKENNPDFILNGIARSSGLEPGNWVLMVMDPNDKEIGNVQFSDGWGIVVSGRELPNVAKELSKRMIRLINARQTR